LDQHPYETGFFQTGFDAAALVASELSTSATGSAAAPLVDPVAGCAFEGSGQPLPKQPLAKAALPKQALPKQALPKQALPKQALPKQALIAALRAAITKIEGHHDIEGYGVDAEPVGYKPAASRQPEIWRLGCPQIDRLLPQGLDPGGVHEVKSLSREDSASAGDWMTSLGFALRLAVRRAVMAQANAQQANLHQAKSQDAPKQDGPKPDGPWILWCWPRALASEFGAPSMLGLNHLGLDPSRVLIVEPARAAEALVALEDGLKSSSLSLALGIFDEIALTPARRLSLAAAASGTPCLLVTHPAAEAAAATSTRWRVQRQLSAPHAFDARAPGNTRFLVNLERCRSQPQNAQHRSSLLEWCDETFAFRLASGVAHRAVGTGVGDGSKGRRRSAG
jgi:hypothetical protein